MPDFSSVKEQTKMWFTVRMSLLVPLIEKKNLYTNQGYSQIIFLELGNPLLWKCQMGIYYSDETFILNYALKISILLTWALNHNFIQD